MASEVMQRTSYRTSGTVARSSDIHKHVGKRQELWTGLQQRLGATPIFGGILSNQKGERVVEDSDDDEDGDVVEDSYLSNGPRSTERARCRSAVSYDGRDSRQPLHPTDPTDDIREPSNISPADECDVVGSNWEAAKVKNGVQLYKSKRSRCEVRGVTHVNASVKNVMSFWRQERAQRHSQMHKRLFWVQTK
ncbi:hypothetical protein PInf_029375 [Phytophthora infestans]|nr:hypothetical protein PInf_029375 [Phytophthora infestans]